MMQKPERASPTGLAALAVLLTATSAPAEQSQPTRDRSNRHVALELSAKAGAAFPNCGDACESTSPGPAFAIDFLPAIGPWFRLGAGLDFASFRYTPPADRERGGSVITIAAIMRIVPIRSDFLDLYADFAFGISNGLGAFAGAGGEVHLSPSVRLGPYARLIWAGSNKQISCWASNGGCARDPPYGSVVVVGIGVTSLWP